MTPQQGRILNAIREFGESHGYQPTVRELMPMVGIYSPGAVHRHLENLRSMGKVGWVEGQARTLHLTVAGELKEAKAA